MTEHDELWMAKDKYGDLWLGTLGATKEDALSNIDNPTWQKDYKLKVVKVKLVEVEEGNETP